MQPRPEPVPAVDVDRDEDRLDEEREALEREAEPEHVAEGRDESRPEQSELEGEDRAGHDADRKEREHDLRPAVRERAVNRIAVAQEVPLSVEDERLERDS